MSEHLDTPPARSVGRLTQRVNATAGIIGQVNSSQSLDQLIAALRSKDAGTVLHAERAARYAHGIGCALGLKPGQLAALHKGALLHDLGKTVVPTSILQKAGPLSPEEWTTIRSHPVVGYRLLAGKVERAVLEIVLYHHERYDGNGYSEGLRGTAIPLLARIFSVAEAFDAMISARPYRPAMPHNAARSELIRCAGSQFDPVVVDAFCLHFEQIVYDQTGLPIMLLQSSALRQTLDGARVPEYLLREATRW